MDMGRFNLFRVSLWLALLVFPVSAAHELGHVLACMVAGVPVVDVVVGVWDFHVVHGVSPVGWVNMVIGLSGGLFAAFSLVPVLGVVRGEAWVVVLGFIYFQAVNGLVEGFMVGRYGVFLGWMVLPFSLCLGASYRQYVLKNREDEYYGYEFHGGDQE